MSLCPEDVLYLDTHQWARREADGSVTVGITDHAQQALGDVVFVELPKIGEEVIAAAQTGIVESVKAASDVFAPISGTVVAVNEGLMDAPERINDAPYGDGWFYRLEPSEPEQLSSLLSASAYQARLEN
ncbi:MAG: glycine cleavage system protein GcvH [Luminiphilus sp.]|jgi:glycine cleavage system H protein|nr:glycine cleavage system protein GcvH [Luminiphilus sp.]